MFWKGVGVIMLLYGVSLFLGAMSGGQNPLQPFSGFQSVAIAKEAATGLTFTRVKSVDALDTALKEAQGKYVMLDFYADWCASCKEYERLTFRDLAVKKHLNNVVLLQADVTENTEADIALLKRFQLFGPPGIAFFDQKGEEIVSNKIVGYQDANQFTRALEKIIPL
jgi:thioredoxin:protein disulfide reductase